MFNLLVLPNKILMRMYLSTIINILFLNERDCQVAGDLEARNRFLGKEVDMEKFQDGLKMPGKCLSGREKPQYCIVMHLLPNSAYIYIALMQRVPNSFYHYLLRCSLLTCTCIYQAVHIHEHTNV